LHPKEPLENHLLLNLGFPHLDVLPSFNHFDFTQSGRRILVIGPMGSGKTEFSARVWRDAQVLLKKSPKAGEKTTNGEADRRRVFFLRSKLDEGRFPDYPPDALAYRGGFESLGGAIAAIGDSFDLEECLADHPKVGTWIIDEASFYDERLVFVMREASEKSGINFLFPTLILNFRKDIFNSTARLLLENATHVLPLTAYCEHQDCLEDAFYTYRFYTLAGEECPAPYFDPLIIVGGDRTKDNPREPNYQTRCAEHHLLPGKEYTYLTLKPLGEKFARGDEAPLVDELYALKNALETSNLFLDFQGRYPAGSLHWNTLKLPLLAERALCFLYGELGYLRENQILDLVRTLHLDFDYISSRLRDNGRPLSVTQTSTLF
jgi:thymidine kinase